MRKNKRMSRAIQLLLVTTAIVSCIAISKYRSAQATDVTAVIANVNMQATIDEVVLNEMKPGVTQEYTFSVKNYTEGNSDASNVQMIYTLEIETGRYLPLEFELLDITEDIGSTQNLLVNNKTNDIRIGPDKQQKDYKLIIKWNESEKTHKYSSEIDYAKIILNSYQSNPNE